MKLIYKLIFGLLLLFCSLSIHAMVIDDANKNFEDLSAVLAVAPVAAVGAVSAFNPEKLKISREDFEQLKARYRKLYVIDINIDDDEHYQYIVIRPSRDLLSAIASYKDDMDKANELIIKNMVVAGDTDALEDGVVYAKLMENVANIISQGTSFLSKA